MRQLAISQCLSLEKDLKARENKRGGEILRTLARPEPFSGQLRSYQPKDDGGEQRPREDKKITSTAKDLLAEFSALFAERMNVTGTKELGNTESKVDVTIDGLVILSQVGPTLLLTLEQKLQEIQGLVQQIHTLPAEENWTQDPNTGHYRSEADTKASTKKVPQVLTLAAATEKHPAQVQVVQEDVVVGYWSTTKLCSSLPIPEKQALLERITKLLSALKLAREEANRHRREESSIGTNLAKYIFG